MYFYLTNLGDEHMKACVATAYYVDDAGLWLRSQGFDWAKLTWSVLKAATEAYFKPKDSHKRNRDLLAACR